MRMDLINGVWTDVSWVFVLFLSSFFKVCERSLSGSGAGPNPAAASQFVRAEMLPSGYLVRPCEGGGSIIHIVDHLNFEVCFLLSNMIIPCYLPTIHLL